ncbi:MAG: LysM peptidoglycan-binding domain-containing protein [Lachnospirales bacterium]
MQNNNDRANQKLNDFEKIDDTRSVNKNITVDGYNDNYSNKVVGGIFSDIKEKDKEQNLSNNQNHNVVRNQKLSEELSYSKIFSRDELDDLNNFDDHESYTNKRPKYDHEYPYNKTFSNPKTPVVSPENLERINEEIKKPFNSNMDTSNLSRHDNPRDLEFKNRKTYNEYSSKETHTYNNTDTSSENNENERDEYSTYASLNALNNNKSYREKGANINIQLGETLKNKIAYEDDSIDNHNNVERPRKRRQIDSFQDDFYREQERREQEELRRERELQSYNESRSRLRKQRMQDTSMQPVIKGHTTNIPYVTTKQSIVTDTNHQQSQPQSQYQSQIQKQHNTQGYSSNKIEHYKTGKADFSDIIKDEPEEEYQNVQKPRKRASADVILKRKYERARARTLTVTLFGIFFTLVFAIAFFFTFYKYNELKDQYTDINASYQDLLYQQPSISKLQLEIDELTEENDSLTAQLNGAVPENNNNTEGETGAETTEDANARPKTYVVQSGDYLTKISIEFYGDDTYVDDIMTANNLTSDSLQVGATLTLP